MVYKSILFNFCMSPWQSDLSMGHCQCRYIASAYSYLRSCSLHLDSIVSILLALAYLLSILLRCDIVSVPGYCYPFFLDTVVHTSCHCFQHWVIATHTFGILQSIPLGYCYLYFQDIAIHTFGILLSVLSIHTSCHCFQHWVFAILTFGILLSIVLSLFVGTRLLLSALGYCYPHFRETAFYTLWYCVGIWILVCYLVPLHLYSIYNIGSLLSDTATPTGT